MLDREHVAIKLRDPLSSLHRQFEVTYRIANVGFNFAPKEAGIALGDIRGTGISKLLIDPSLGKLMKESIELARIKWVSQLSDQIGSTNQTSLRIGFFVISVVWYGEPSQLDRSAIRSPSINGCDAKRIRTAICDRETW